MRRFFPEFVGGARGVALLALRLVAGTAFVFHGWDKIQHPMNWINLMQPDAPVPGWLQLLAAVSEFGGGIAWILGALTPLFSFGILCTMAVATFGVHMKAGHPFIGDPATHGPSYESSLGYLAIALVLMLVGPGRLSVDSLLFGRGPIITPDPARELSA